MYRSKSLPPLSFRKMFANALMLSQFDYLDIIWSKTFKNRLNELYILYKKSSQDCSRCECSRIICRNVQENGMVSSPSKETATSQHIYASNNKWKFPLSLHGKIYLLFWWIARWEVLQSMHSQIQVTRGILLFCSKSMEHSTSDHKSK